MWNWGHSPFSSKRGQTPRRVPSRLIASKWGVTHSGASRWSSSSCRIVVIATAGSALLGTLSYLSGQGGNYLLQAQAQSIADAYLNEITGKCFADCVPGAEANRQQFDDVTDYNGLDTLGGHG